MQQREQLDLSLLRTAFFLEFAFVLWLVFQGTDACRTVMLYMVEKVNVMCWVHHRAVHNQQHFICLYIPQDIKQFIVLIKILIEMLLNNIQQQMA